MSKLEENDEELLKSIVNNPKNFRDLIFLSRISFFFCLTLWIIAFFDINVPFSSGISSLNIAVFMYCLPIFLLTMLCAPKQVISTVLTIFFVCLLFIVSTFGYSSAKNDVKYQENGIIRDGVLVKIVDKNTNTYEVEVKPITLPITFIQYILEN